MPNDGAERLIELLEKALMVHLHSIGVAQAVIAKILNKRNADVNEFLKPITKRKR
jgi:hypothetical protein